MPIDYSREGEMAKEWEFQREIEKMTRKPSEQQTETSGESESAGQEEENQEEKDK